MSKINIRKAELQDNAAIRALMALPIHGMISVRFERNPDYFLGAAYQTDTSEVMVCEEPGSKRITAVVQIGFRKVYWKGAWKDFRYLCDLRVHPDYEKGRSLALILRTMNEIFMETNSYGFLYVFSDNSSFLDLILKRLSSNKIWLHAKKLTTIQSFMISIAAKSKEIVDPSIVQHVTKDQWNTFTRSIIIQDLSSPVPDYQATEQDLWLFKLDEHKEIVACLEAIDLSAMKQTIMHAYHPLIRFFRPLLNIFSKIAGGINLPSAGQKMDYVNVHHMFSTDNSTSSLLSLLEALRFHLNLKKYKYFLVGFDQNDPMANEMHQFRSKRVIDGEIWWMYPLGSDEDKLIQDGPVRVEVARI